MAISRAQISKQISQPPEKRSGLLKKKRKKLGGSKSRNRKKT
jgi:hypothetical protein